MPLVLTGDSLGVREEPVERGGKSWVEKTLVVLDGYVTHFATLVKDFEGVIPEPGEKVAVRVAVHAFKKRDGSVGYAYTAFGREPHVEKLLGTASVSKVS